MIVDMLPKQPANRDIARACAAEQPLDIKPKEKRR